MGESGPRPEGVPTWIFRDFPSTESSDLDPCRRATVGLGGFEQVPSDTERQAWILPLHSVIMKIEFPDLNPERVIIRAIIRTKIITKNPVAACHEGCSDPINRLADTSGKTYIFKRDSFGLYDFCLSESELHSYDRKHS